MRTRQLSVGLPALSVKYAGGRDPCTCSYIWSASPICSRRLAQFTHLVSSCACWIALRSVGMANADRATQIPATHQRDLCRYMSPIALFLNCQAGEGTNSLNARRYDSAHLANAQDPNHAVDCSKCRNVIVFGVVRPVRNPYGRRVFCELDPTSFGHPDTRLHGFIHKERRFSSLPKSAVPICSWEILTHHSDAKVPDADGFVRARCVVVGGASEAVYAIGPVDDVRSRTKLDACASRRCCSQKSR